MGQISTSLPVNMSDLIAEIYPAAPTSRKQLLADIKPLFDNDSVGKYVLNPSYDTNGGTHLLDYRGCYVDFDAPSVPSGFSPGTHTQNTLSILFQSSTDFQPFTGAGTPQGSIYYEWECRQGSSGAVSYTHLTLPTICSV